MFSANTIVVCHVSLELLASEKVRECLLTDMMPNCWSPPHNRPNKLSDQMSAKADNWSVTSRHERLLQFSTCRSVPNGLGGWIELFVACQFRHDLIKLLGKVSTLWAVALESSSTGHINGPSLESGRVTPWFPWRLRGTSQTHTACGCGLTA